MFHSCLLATLDVFRDVPELPLSNFARFPMYSSFLEFSLIATKSTCFSFGVSRCYDNKHLSMS